MAHLSPEDVERLRRSLAMISPANPASLTRDQAERLVAELGRLQGVIGDAVVKLRGALDDLEGA